MPIFEYLCHDCRRKFSLLVGVSAHEVAASCPRCGGTNYRKLISRIARVRSEEAIMEELADPTKIGDPENPRDLARWARKMGSALGEEGGEDFDAMVDEMMEGESHGGEEGLSGHSREEDSSDFDDDL
ncbi:MAG: zinc ribbon domain-containing protein [Candidatus Tectomicrobia bacterium]|uniref:Zinc ribbon domain-containing protein n=1 Tax=Tectimicrobiota bacterium TaxID=2528274 RepID=A0A932M0F8_UNCTE|nr:zinc ribbon domain-containing protein [Candidatus Tectomicrobia bacterium]